VKRTLILLISIFFMALLSSCSLTQPRVDHASLFAKLRKYDPSLQYDHFVSTRVDLNDDECSDAIVMMTPKSKYCGSRGCVMIVMLCEEGELKPIAKTTHVNPIVSTSRNKTLGLKNIDVVVRPKFDQPHQVTLRYNGKNYPNSALYGEKLPKRALERVIFK